jgi:endonuclease YncB( thermonuclease family)
MGGKSKAFMVRLVHRKRVTCALNGQKTHDRWVGTCYIDGRDIGTAIIAAGLARDCPRSSGGRYAGDETAQSRTLPLPRYCLKR